MTSMSMKGLAKKRAKKDVKVPTSGSRIDSEDPKVETYTSEYGVQKREEARAADELKSSVKRNSFSPNFKDAKPEEEPDTMSRNPRVKQMRKFNMLRKLLIDMDDMDGDGKAD